MSAQKAHFFWAHSSLRGGRMRSLSRGFVKMEEKGMDLQVAQKGGGAGAGGIVTPCCCLQLYKLCPLEFCGVSVDLA